MVDNGIRSTDEQYRNNIANNFDIFFSKTNIPTNVVVLEGPHEQRKEIIKDLFQIMLSKKLKNGKKIKPKDRPHYVNSKEFEEEIKVYYKTGNCSEKLCESLKTQGPLYERSRRK